MSANYNLAPFNNIVPHCPFCGLSPMSSPCEHLKAILELEEPYEGGTEIKFLSDDFRQLLKDTVNSPEFPRHPVVSIFAAFQSSRVTASHC